jgi:peptide/nickel transport system substrate-binding protein
VGVAAVTCAALAACSAASVERTGGESGGDAALTVVALGPVATWDPQRMTSRRDMAFAGRVFARTLTAFPAGDDAAGQRRLTGDLATSTGTPGRDLRTWAFTLRDDAKWQDGSAVTCEDVRYGVSRSFAAPFSSEGLNYALATLDIPKKPDGTSSYSGPYDGVGQAGFDRAVTCEGRTVTFRLTDPRADFDEMVSLPAFAPYKKAADRGDKSKHTVFSNGPYQLEGAWDPSTGGTFVRNPSWSPASDPVRKGQPARIRYQEGVESQTAAQRIMADEGENRRAVALDSAPPAIQHNITGVESLRARSVNPSTALVDYLAPNLKSPVMSVAKARRALAVSTNRDGYVAALGGPTAASPAYSLLGPQIPGHTGTDPFGSGSGGDPLAARTLLRESGLALPVPVRVAYRTSPTADKAMAALENGWEAAGFAVTLQPIDKDYFAAASAPGRAALSDVIWANWAADWPSAATILPALFDSRVNLSAAGSGRDFGYYADPRANALMSSIPAIADAAEREQAWAELDASLAGSAVYIGLAQHRALYIAGSDVGGLAANEALGGYVDLAEISVR